MNKTCNNCLHRELCNSHGYIDADECFYFKDKSRYIELPCAVGQTVWVLWSLTKAHKKGVYPAKAYALRYDTKKNNMRVCVKGTFNVKSYDGEYNHYYQGTFSWNNVGKTVFLTKEEAEQALKGGNNNA